MPVVLDKTRCPHNHVCPLIEVCPVEAISQGADGFPIVNYDLCIECEECTHACPMKAMQFRETK
ncbi:MAG: 4Fe-4S binding protein [Alistipes sp.]